MAATLTSDLKASLGWSSLDALDLATVTDSSILSYTKSLASGTAADQADRIWHDQRSILTTANDDLDLTALTYTLYGATVTIAFAKLKAILIVNLSTVAGEELRLDSAVTNGILTPFAGSATSKVEIGADSFLYMCSKKDGWAVTAGTGDILRVHNPNATTVQYKIVLVGTSI